MLHEVFSPWRRPSTWWALVHLLLGIWVTALTFTVVVSIGATAASLVITFPLAIPVVWLLFVAGRGVGRVERSRYAALLGLDLADPVPPLRATSWWGRWKERFTVKARWKELAHPLLAFPLSAVSFAVVVAAWAGSAALLALPAYVSALPGSSAKFWLFDVHQGPASVLAAVVGLVGLALVAPWVTVGLARAEGALARWLLGPSSEVELEARVTELESSRQAAVGSAEAERRRIERDLHDGAQQRLVALAVTLGEARERLDDDPDRGRQLVAESHEEAKAALAEIRDLVRGIHPVILEDRGLDAALSAVVARVGVPVDLAVEVPDRPAPEVESAAYFVVTEALTNVSRHAEAAHAAVSILRKGDRLVIEVRDDGRGGADEGAGTGLTGLRERVRALGGWMHVSSPSGGPTTVLVELPCAS